MLFAAQSHILQNYHVAVWLTYAVYKTSFYTLVLW